MEREQVDVAFCDSSTHRNTSLKITACATLGFEKCIPSHRIAISGSKEQDS